MTNCYVLTGGAVDAVQFPVDCSHYKLPGRKLKTFSACLHTI